MKLLGLADLVHAMFRGALLLVLSSSVAWSYDIIGIEPGMTLDEAREIISEKVPGASSHTQNADVRRIQGSRIRGWKYPASLVASVRHEEQVWVQGLAPPHHGTVGAIFRSAGLQEQMRLDDLKAVFERKYGPVKREIKLDSRGFSWLWSWSERRDGRPLTDSLTLQKCAGPSNDPSGSGMRGEAMQVTMISDAASFANGKFNDCRNFLAVQVMVSSTGAVGRFHTVAWDLDLIEKSNRETVQQTIIEAERIEKERQEKLDNAQEPTL